MLSNTATPKYYGQFREAVLRGDIPVCKEVSMQMNLIDDLIRDPNVYYDSRAVEGFIHFCENELTLTDGSDMHLLDSFKLWSEDIFGWWYFVDRNVYVQGKNGKPGRYVRKRIRKRLRNKQYLIVARGAAKSVYLSCIQAFFLTVDPKTTHQITTAPTMKQADEVMSPFRTAIIRARGPLFGFLTEGSLQNTTGPKADRVKLASTKDGIRDFVTGSLLEVRPMSISKLQGPRCKIATVDEWLSGDIQEDVIGALEQSAAKGNVEDYLIIAASSEGTVRNAAGDSIKMELMEILRGNYRNPHVSIWYYKLDDQREVAHPEKWLKANPNLGKTVSYETYELDKERMEYSPSNKNDILAKRFGIPVEGYTYFFTYDETRPTIANNDFWSLPCAMGADLSLGDDFCAFTFLFPRSSGEFGVKTRCYISEYTLARLSVAMRQKYQEFLNEDSLVVMDGTVLDFDRVYDELDRYIEEHEWDVIALGFDPYNAKTFIERWTSEHTPYGIEKVAQGAKTESVPLGELKKLAEQRMLLFDQEIMAFCLGNCIAIQDTNGNRKLSKKRNDAKIDSVAALMDAYVAYKAHKEDFD